MSNQTLLTNKPMAITDDGVALRIDAIGSKCLVEFNDRVDTGVAGLPNQR
jgi:hypothetical protein